MTDIETATGLALSTIDAEAGTGLSLGSGSSLLFAAATPVRLITDDGVVTARAYDSIERDGEATIGQVDAVLPDGTRVVVVDRWSPSAEGDSLLVNRSFTIAA